MFNMDTRIQRAVDVQMKHTESLMKNKHIMGVSVRPVDGYVHNPEAYALVVLVDEEADRDHIPSTIDDVPVIIQRVRSSRTQ